MAEPPKKKKRKRDAHEDEVSNASKEVAREAKNVTFTMVDDIGEWNPALVFSPGLNYGLGGPMDVFSRTRSSGATQSIKQDILLHSANHPKLDYIAREETAGDAQSLLKHYIAVHDPKTGETQVISARRLVLRSTLQSARVTEEVNDKTPARKTAMESRTLLGEAFGTKKSQKALRSLTENAIVSEEKVKKDPKGKLILEDAAAVVIDAMGETGILPTKQALQDAIDQAKPTPRPNLSAETPAAVYHLQDLAATDILVRLNIAKLKHAVKNNTDIPTVSMYFSKRLTRIVGMKDDEKLKALRLILTLIEWRKTFKSGRRDTWMLVKDDDTKASITDYDHALMGKIKAKFAPEASLSPWHIDYINTHICALALIIDNFSTDTFDLKNDLGLDNRRIIQYFRELGCRINVPRDSDLKDWGIRTKAEASNHSIAKLRIPLTFPKMRTPARKR